MSPSVDERLHNASAAVMTALAILGGPLHEETRRAARVHLLVAQGELAAALQLADLHATTERSSPALRVVR